MLYIEQHSEIIIELMLSVPFNPSSTDSNTTNTTIKNLCQYGSTKLIHIVETHYLEELDNVYWILLAKNPNALYLFEKYIDNEHVKRIDPTYFYANPNIFQGTHGLEPTLKFQIAELTGENNHLKSCLSKTEKELNMWKHVVQLQAENDKLKTSLFEYEQNTEEYKRKVGKNM